MSTKKKIMITTIVALITLCIVLIIVNQYNKAGITKENKTRNTVSNNTTSVSDNKLEELEKKINELEEKNKELNTQVADLTTEVSNNVATISANAIALNEATAKKIVGIHDVTISVGTDWNTFLDQLTADVGGSGQVIPITDDVDLNEPGTYTVHWTLDDKAEDTSTVIVVE